jgi:formylglycine-generating enzyme required for sulfatase activity
MFATQPPPRFKTATMQQVLAPLAAIKTIREQLVPIPGGEIMLRDDRVKQQWSVAVAPFLLAKYPITQELYAAITNEAPSSFRGDQDPVETVSWREAVQFCNMLSAVEGLSPYYLLSTEAETMQIASKATGYRLPTEAEWEVRLQSRNKRASVRRTQRHCLVQGQLRKNNPPRGLEAAECLGAVRHARQRVGVVLGCLQ